MAGGRDREWTLVQKKKGKTPNPYQDSQRLRSKHIRQEVRCFRCLRLGHLAKNCRDPVTCKRCKGVGHRQLTCVKGAVGGIINEGANNKERGTNARIEDQWRIRERGKAWRERKPMHGWLIGEVISGQAEAEVVKTELWKRFPAMGQTEFWPLDSGSFLIRGMSMAVHAAMCGWKQRLNSTGIIQWRCPRGTDGAVGARRGRVVLEARGVPFGYRTEHLMGNMIRPVGQLCEIISTGIQAGDPNLVLLEVEIAQDRRIPQWVILRTPNASYKVGLAKRAPTLSPGDEPWDHQWHTHRGFTKQGEEPRHEGEQAEASTEAEVSARETPVESVHQGHCKESQTISAPMHRADNQDSDTARRGAQHTPSPWDNTSRKAEDLATLTQQSRTQETRAAGRTRTAGLGILSPQASNRNDTAAFEERDRTLDTNEARREPQDDSTPPHLGENHETQGTVTVGGCGAVSAPQVPVRPDQTLTEESHTVSRTIWPPAKHRYNNTFYKRRPKNSNTRDPKVRVANCDTSPRAGESYQQAQRQQTEGHRISDREANATPDHGDAATPSPTRRTGNDRTQGDPVPRTSSTTAGASAKEVAALPPRERMQKVAETAGIVRRRSQRRGKNDGK